MSIIFKDYPIKNNQSYIKNVQVADERYREFQTRGPLGAVLHSIGTPQPHASMVASYFNDPKVEASVHMILEPTGSCYRLAPDNYRMWHVGGSANNTHMGIEMTEPRGISYDPSKGYRVTILDQGEALAHVTATYDRAVELFADLCIKYGWDPLKDGVILSHKECYDRGIGSNHGDPEHLWKALSLDYTMDTFRADVAAAVKRIQNQEEEEEMTIRTMADLRALPNGRYYLPTIQKLIDHGFLLGKGGTGDDFILDFTEGEIRILVLLDRFGTIDLAIKGKETEENP